MLRHRQYIVIDQGALAILKEVATGMLDPRDIERTTDGRWQVWIDKDVFNHLLGRDPSQVIKEAYRTGGGIV